MPKQSINVSAKHTVNIIGGFEINARALYPVAVLSDKTGICTKKLRKLIKAKELTAKRISKGWQIAGYSFVEWLNSADEEAEEGGKSGVSSEKE